MTGRFLLAFVVLVGCWGRSPDTNEQLAEIALPSDLEQLDAPVQQQFREHWQALETLRADPDTSASRLAGAYGRLGMVLHAYGYQDAAVAAYRNAVALDSSELRFTYYLGRLERARGHLLESQTALAAVLAREPGNLPTLVLTAENALDLHQPADAERRFREALARDPSCGSARLGIARLALSAGDPARAVAELEPALARQPDAAAIHYLLGQAYQQLGNRDQAQHHLDAVPAHNLHQDLLAVDDPWMAALEDLRVGARVHDLRALKAAAAGRFELAAVEYRQALAIDPDRIYARYGLATAFLALGRREDAANELALLLEADPNHTASHLLLARLRLEAGDLTSAEHHLRRVVALAPDEVEGHRWLAAILRRTGRAGEAGTHAARAATLAPGSE